MKYLQLFVKRNFVVSTILCGCCFENSFFSYLSFFNYSNSLVNIFCYLLCCYTVHSAFFLSKIQMTISYNEFFEKQVNLQVITTIDHLAAKL